MNSRARMDATRGPGGISVSRAVTILASILVASTAAGAEDTVPTFGETLEYLGFDDDDRARVLRGEIVAKDFREDHVKELSVAVVMLSALPMDRLVEDLRQGELLHAGGQILAYRMIDPDDSLLDAFQGIGYAPHEGKELRKLLAARPGSTFNLSSGEFDRFRNLRERFPTSACDRDPECASAVSATYRRILLQRMESYWKSGLQGVAPYSRGGGENVQPADEMRESAEDATLVQRNFPEFYRAFLDYPEAQGEHCRNQFLWVKHQVQGRPAFALGHRLFYERPDMALIAERQFYVGTSYSALQTFIGVLPDGDRSFLFYTNRTFTEQVAGFGSSLRHAVGRKRMMASIVRNFEELRTHVHP